VAFLATIVAPSEAFQLRANTPQMRASTPEALNYVLV